MLIEPIAELASECLRNRPLAAIVVAAVTAPDAARSPIPLEDADLLTSVGDSRYACGVTLYQVVDFLLDGESPDLVSIDGEGHEPECAGRLGSPPPPANAHSHRDGRCRCQPPLQPRSATFSPRLPVPSPTTPGTPDHQSQIRVQPADGAHGERGRPPLMLLRRHCFTHQTDTENKPSTPWRWNAGPSGWTATDGSRLTRTASRLRPTEPGEAGPGPRPARD